MFRNTGYRRVYSGSDNVIGLMADLKLSATVDQRDRSSGVGDQAGLGDTVEDD